MKLISIFLIPCGLAFSTMYSDVGFAASERTKCLADAKSKAKALLDFYSKLDSRAAVGEPKEALPIESPDKKRKYRVLEVPGFIYKASFRIRLIYASTTDDTCLLMGEEILDLSSL